MKKKDGNYSHHSLFDFFKSGEQVIRVIRNDDGRKEKYEGTIIAMNDDQLEIYWHTLDGEFCPDRIEDHFTICNIDEVLNGKSDRYSPIERKKKYVYSYYHSLFH